MNFKAFAKSSVFFCLVILGASKTALAKTDAERAAWLASHKISVPQKVKWQKRKFPPAIQKQLAWKANVIKCGVAAIGPQGTTRWVLAWTVGALKDAEGEIHISVFSQQGSRYLKLSDRKVGVHLVRNIRLYWLRPHSLSGPVVYFGDGLNDVGEDTVAMADLVVFPDGWQNQVFSQRFERIHFYPHDTYYALPFLDDRGVLCVVQFVDWQDGEKIYQTTTVLHWNGKSWN